MNNLEKKQSRDKYMVDFKNAIDYSIENSDEEQKKMVIKLMYEQMVLISKNLIECEQRLQEYEKNETLLLALLQKRTDERDKLMSLGLDRAKRNGYKINTSIKVH